MKRYNTPNDYFKYGYDEDISEERFDLEDEEFSEEDFENAATIPNPTFDENNRLDYVALMRDYHSDNVIKRNSAAEAIIGDLTGLVLYVIKKKYPSYTSKYYDDLVQSGLMGITVGLRDYDPEKSKPSTYFYYFIVHEMQDWLNQNVYKTTPYYSVNIKKVNKAIAKLESMGAPSTARDISIQTGIPIDTVEKTLRIMNGTAEIGLSFCENNLDDPDFGNPEFETLKKEGVEQIYKIIAETLTQEETLILFYLHGLGEMEQLPLKDIAKKLNISIDKVKKAKQEIYCKLKNSSLAQYRPDSYRNELIELDDTDSVTFFPIAQATNSLHELDDIVIDF